MIKTINSKMTTNSQLSITEPKDKNKQSKQLEQEQNHRNRDITWRVIIGECVGGEQGKGTENKMHKWQVQNRQGEVKNIQEMEKPKDLYV